MFCLFVISYGGGVGLSPPLGIALATPTAVFIPLIISPNIAQPTLCPLILGGSKAVIGSQQVPYIYEDRTSKEQMFSALTKIYFMGKEERKKIGLLGREYVLKNYNYESFSQKWVSLMDKIVKDQGSWDKRKNYCGIRFMEVA